MKDTIQILDCCDSSQYNLFYSPAKMVAKLRDVKTDDNLLLLKTNMSAGHDGGSGRYDGYKELAYQYAVIFDIFANGILEEAAEKDAANAGK